MVDSTADKSRPRGALAWEKAKRLLRRHYAQKFDGWPESFTVAELACLQYPLEGAEAEKLTARRNRDAFIGTLQAAIEQGTVGVVTRTDSRDIMNTVTGYARPARRVAYSSYLDNAEPQVAILTTKLEKVGEEPMAVIAIERNALLAWLRTESEKPSGHVEAWLSTAPLAPKTRHIPTGPTRANSNDAVKQERQYRDRLHVAMEAGFTAYKKKHDTTPTSDNLFDWLIENDETGTVIGDEDGDDNKLWWKMSSGGYKSITRKSFAGRMTKIRAKSPN